MKELAKITDRYCGQLREKFTYVSPLPNEPAVLDDRITAFRVVLIDAVEPDAVLVYHLACCLEKRNQPGDRKIAIDMLRRAESPDLDQYWSLRIRLV